MLRTCAVCAFALILIGLVTSTASAGIVDYTCGPDADGVIKCSPNPCLSPDEGGGVYSLAIKGSQGRFLGRAP